MCTWILIYSFISNILLLPISIFFNTRKLSLGLVMLWMLTISGGIYVEVPSDILLVTAGHQFFLILMLFFYQKVSEKFAEFILANRAFSFVILLLLMGVCLFITYFVSQTLTAISAC